MFYNCAGLIEFSIFEHDEYDEIINYEETYKYKEYFDNDNDLIDEDNDGNSQSNFYNEMMWDSNYSELAEKIENYKIIKIIVNQLYLLLKIRYKYINMIAFMI